jgi:hypothetical protein
MPEGLGLLIGIFINPFLEVGLQDVFEVFFVGYTDPVVAPVWHGMVPFVFWFGWIFQNTPTTDWFWIDAHHSLTPPVSFAQTGPPRQVLSGSAGIR